MPLLTEAYKGFELRLHIMGPPPFAAMVRRPNSSLYEAGHVEADTESALRAAAQAWVDRLLNDVP